jgi:Flp pilus assembly protein TadD
LQQGRLDEALRHLEHVVQVRPDRAEFRFNYSVALAQKGRRQEALAQLAEALRLRPNYAEAEQLRGTLTSAP